MEQTLAAIAQHLRGRLIGDGAVRIRGVNSLDAVQLGEITFADTPRHLAQAIASQASAVIVSAEVRELGGRPGISVQNPKLAFALTLDLFHPSGISKGGVHPTAVLGDRVQVGEGASIGAHAVIGNDVGIGRGTTIESGVHIGDGATIGEDGLIGPNAVIYRQTRIGHRVRIHGGSVIGGDGFGYIFHEGRHVKIPQVGNVVIEDDVEIGCNVCVDRATVGSTLIRRGTKIDNLVQIAHNDRIGEHVVMAGHVGLSGSVTIGNYVALGGKAGVVDHITIGDRAQVGAASVVTKSVAAGEAVWGYPARPLRSAKHQLALLGRLPALLASMAKLIARLRPLEERLDRLEQANHAQGASAPGASRES
ncbi:MAG: UDP-3-O-(3-hydroxymyristoyl)glucosamine N-acyltransferase [Candidatus Omnitrophica bacterium]|nr:UDP-3-O-(3-hydroxymyristoyl)glucosamine N-acyltransferase [Candidatus Omnitrophota bacterium]